MKKYNKGKTNVCDIKNKYRIIGYVPVVVNGKQEFRTKVIKAEYLTELEFETMDKVINYGSYKNKKRTESEEESLAGYHWNDVKDNTYNSSTSLYTSLNSSIYLNKAFGKIQQDELNSLWQDKIENVFWNVGGVDSVQYTAKEAYNTEVNDIGKTVTVENKIGLMYLHDYGFAASSINWDTVLNKQYTDNNRNNNWLFNGVHEWTICRYTIHNYNALVIDNSGYIGDHMVNGSSNAIRPVFYLKPEVSLIGDETHNGTKSNPLKVKI